jgi:hypothetical protein
MPACVFSVPFSGNVEDVLTKAQSAIQGQGGNFKGDTDSGDFNVSVFGNVIAGSYTVKGQEMNIIIDSKPFLIPCSTIENFMKNQIGG